ncbi:MAG: dihydrofolate reductase family protein [Leptospirales bacterium]|jgi:2,5-diamino-6-(ribosylamino)-4(3H)-pyrimidinone 5'-phosphate reductase
MSVSEFPRVAVNMAMTLDGKVMRPDGGWHGLTSDADRARMDRYRQAADVIFVGKNSIAADDPVVLPARLRKSSGTLKGGEQWPVPCMIARSSLPPADRKLFLDSNRRGVRPLLFIGRDQDAVVQADFISPPVSGQALRVAGLPQGDASDTENLAALIERADVLPFARELLEPAMVLDWLYRERGVRRVLLEGGPKVNHAFFAADLVDVLYLTLVPFLIGRNDLPGIVDGDEAFTRFDQPGRWRLDRSEAVGREVFLKYSRIR